ncbi:ribosome-associated heat shock protein Hsp15 [Idiomarina sp. OT37-5b]|jgi:ribosome-associated heat shock protein Hsp15|uniref:Heat shock protein 15 n=1 Tax=Idiomarina aquatica TaxID=1327752 RepID=A0AA94EG46_9GAMM|nr:MULTISPECIES: ribosome-associated heat shock protein Hsp15 [Idiomarina]AVJ55226.1 ribosome-associated heat shock protein Hsp15 [Idiomarina sp. OT37-5b]RUO45246.1 heat-shock protein [Idiomarina aquatica]
MTTANAIRLDKWLWAARFYKTRAIARQMIQSGKVHYNGQRTKPSKAVEIGAMLKLRQGFDSKEVEVIALSDQRRGASEAQLLYRETESSIKQREQNAQARKLNAMYNPHPQGRPDKKQRRQLIRMKDGQRNEGDGQ